VKTYDNNIILSAAAQQIIHELELKICLNKVEAHAGIEYNEIADHLAQVSRIAPLQDPRISINSHSLNHVKIIPTWNDLTLEFSIKTMAKNSVVKYGLKNGYDKTELDGGFIQIKQKT